MKQYTNTLPRGPYMVEVIDVEEGVTSVSGSRVMQVKAVIVGTDRLIHAWFAQVPRARCLELGVRRWEDLPKIKGRRYIVGVNVQNNRNMITEWMVQVV